MDPGPMPMGGDFSGMAGEPPPGFLPQPPPPNDPQLMSQRASPEFLTSQGEPPATAPVTRTARFLQGFA